MMLDLTKEVALAKDKYALYRKLQLSLYLLAILSAAYLALLILFPIMSFVFDFSSPLASMNTITAVHTGANTPITKGAFKSDAPLSFDASLNGTNSEAIVEFQLSKDSPRLSTGKVEVRKSYQAFAYPTGNAISFKDGTLLSTGTEKFIVSAGKLRKFQNDNIINNFGYSQDAFQKITNSDLAYNDRGEDISNNSDYLQSSLFKIDGTYYILIDNKLHKFISEKAYLSQYDADQAIEKSADFLKNYAVDENPIGFSDGSLISYGISAFVVSGQNILPISSPVTFTSFGYDWNDIIPVSGDEFSMYAKGKLFGLSSIHPDGTIFSTENNTSYMVEAGEKHLLPTAAIVSSWLKKKPIQVSAKSDSLSASCSMAKDTLSFRNYSCAIPINPLQDNIGKDYIFQATTNTGVKIATMQVTFKKDYTTANLRQSLSDLFHGVINKYVPTN